MPKTTTANFSSLGSNCWKAVRFCGGVCKHTKTCKYPEKNTCKAYIDTTQVIRIPKRIYANGGSK